MEDVTELLVTMLPLVILSVPIIIIWWLSYTHSKQGLVNRAKRQIVKQQVAQIKWEIKLGISSPEKARAEYQELKKLIYEDNNNTTGSSPLLDIPKRDISD